MTRMEVPQRERAIARSLIAMKKAGLSAALAVATACGAAHAATVSGSMEFSPSGGVLDLSWRSDLANLQFTSAQVTFSALMTPHLYNMGYVERDYTLDHQERFLTSYFTDIDGTFYWSAYDRITYKRILERNYSETDQAFLQASIGSLSGRDDMKGTLTTTTRALEEITERQTSWAYMDTSTPKSIGYVNVVASYLDFFTAENITTTSKRALSVTLDLDTALLADLSANRSLRYSLNGWLIYDTSIRLDYTANTISAVPEPESTTLALSGVAMVAGVGAWRRRTARRA